MKPKPGSPPGIELDGHGNVIPFEQRTKEDQDAALAAGARGAGTASPDADCLKATPAKSGKKKP